MIIPTKINLLDINPLTSNILQEYSPQMKNNLDYLMAIATADQFSAGLSWYENAHKMCLDNAGDYGMSLDQYVGIVAVLSPAVFWENNIKYANNLIGLGYVPKYTGYGNSIRSALRIMAGESIYNVTRGNKVLSFYNNILYPQDHRHITIDTHAIRALCHNNDIGFNNSNKVCGKTKKYELCASVYRELSIHYSIIPNQLQAITWSVYRENYAKRTLKS